MTAIAIPTMRDNTTIARVVAMDSGGTAAPLDSGAILVTAPGRLFLSRRGIESALGYPLRRSVWQGLAAEVREGVVAIADDMTLLVERDAERARMAGAPADDEDAGYTTQRYRSKAT